MSFELLAIILPLVLFFVVQVTINKEGVLTVIALLISALALYQSSNLVGESVLFACGLFLGIVIEVGLGLVLRTQHWEKASFFGVPYWLPVMWGYGFVIIHRFGDLILQRFY